MNTTTATTCKKIDIHSHILHDLDHGSSSLKMSIELLKLAKKAKITNIICTPHYKYNNSNYMKKFKELSFYANKLGIKLHIGNEILLNNSTLGEIKYKKINTLNNSKFLLIEFNKKINDSLDTIFNYLNELLELNYTVIIAHPEIYLNIFNKKKNLKLLKDMGILFQIDAYNFYKKRKYNRYIKYMLKNNLVDFIASDVHEFRINYNEYEKLCKYIIKKYGYDYAYKIFYKNQLEIIKQQS